MADTRAAAVHNVANHALSWSHLVYYGAAAFAGESSPYIPVLCAVIFVII